MVELCVKIHINRIYYFAGKLQYPQYEEGKKVKTTFHTPPIEHSQDVIQYATQNPTQKRRRRFSEL